MRRTHPRAGFTLLELMVVVAIIGILAAIAGTALIYGNGHARLNNTSFEIASMSNVAQMRAQATGHPQYLVFYTKGTESGVVLLDRPETATGVAAPAWTAVDPTLEGSTGGSLSDRISWTTNSTSSQRAGLQWEPLTSFAALKQPWSAIALTPSGGSGLLAACTFCIAGAGGATLGAIRYAPSGTVSIATNTAAVAGGAVAMSVAGKNTGDKRPRVFAFSTPTGAIKVITKVNE